MPVKDLTGQLFGKLAVLERAGSDGNGNAKWLCKCTCEKHTQKIVLGFALRNGTVKSCGCLVKEPGNGNTQNIKNKIYGNLTALEPTQERDRKGSVIWKCVCVCGKIVFSSIADLNRGHKKSCGCLFSSGEKEIADILDQNNISYKRQFTSDCVNSETNKKLRFDFAIFLENILIYLIEFDGEQHFVDVPIFSSSLQDIQKKDQIKNQWCIENKIPLIRIPYTKLGKIYLKDLLPETSKYLMLR